MSPKFVGNGEQHNLVKKTKKLFYGNLKITSSDVNAKLHCG